jgi:hypothetical protein
MHEILMTANNIILLDGVPLNFEALGFSLPNL